MVQVEGLKDGYSEWRKLVLQFSLGLVNSGLGFGIQRLWKVLEGMNPLTWCLHLIGDQQPDGAGINTVFLPRAILRSFPSRQAAVGAACVYRDTRIRSILTSRGGEQIWPGCVLKARPRLCVSGQEPVQSKVDGVVIARRLINVCSVVVMLKTPARVTLCFLLTFLSK